MINGTCCSSKSDKPAIAASAQSKTPAVEASTDKKPAKAESETSAKNLEVKQQGSDKSDKKEEKQEHSDDEEDSSDEEMEPEETETEADRLAREQEEQEAKERTAEREQKLFDAGLRKGALPTARAVEAAKNRSVQSPSDSFLILSCSVQRCAEPRCLGGQRGLQARANSIHCEAHVSNEAPFSHLITDNFISGREHLGRLCSRRFAKRWWTQRRNCPRCGFAPFHQ